MKAKRIELPEFYNVACIMVSPKQSRYIYQYTFKGYMISVPYEDNGRDCLKDNKYFTYNLN